MRWASIERCQSLTLDVNAIRRAGLIRPGERSTGPMRWRDAGVTLRLTVDATATGGVVRLEGKVWTPETGTFRLDQSIELVTTETGLPGLPRGRRFWFRCPRQSRRVAKLYLPNGAARFASRQAYRLIHESRRLAPPGRLNLRARSLRAKLGGEPCNLADYPGKPKRMRWRTYDAALDRIEAWEAAADAALSPKLTRLLARCKWGGP